ncbi:MAG: hypothetical protein CM15mP22_4090 [Gammaproteobacteria bacterium]|nr:MAG: hypothetical protein CM15mP22_4090 [Gammaproteobacteria bacterium]
MTEKEIWSKIIEEAESLLSSERLSNSYINKFVKDFDNLSDVIAFKISNDLETKIMSTCFLLKFYFLS